MLDNLLTDNEKTGDGRNVIILNNPWNFKDGSRMQRRDINKNGNDNKKEKKESVGISNT